MASKLVYVLNGPNLNRLGKREPAIYGSQTLEDIGALLEESGAKLDCAIEMRQSNHEGALVDWLHEAEDTLPGGSAIESLRNGSKTEVRRRAQEAAF